MTDIVKIAESILLAPYEKRMGLDTRGGSPERSGGLEPRQTNQLQSSHSLREVVCPLCRGSRWSPLCHIDGLGYIQGERCPECAGTGYIVEEARD